MQYPFPFVTFVTAPLEVDSDCGGAGSAEQRAATSAGPETAAAD